MSDTPPLNPLLQNVAQVVPQQSLDPKVTGPALQLAHEHLRYVNQQSNDQAEVARANKAYNDALNAHSNAVAAARRGSSSQPRGGGY